MPRGVGGVGEAAECFIQDSHEAIFRTLDVTEGGFRMLYLR